MLNAGRIILAQLVVVLAVAEDAPRLTLHRGLHFQPLSKVLATSAQTVDVPINLRLPPWVESRELVETLKKLLLRQSPQLHDFIVNTTSTVEAAHERINAHFHEVQHTTRLQQERGARRRRSANPFHAISSLLGSCCGFSTYDDVRLLEERDDVVLDYVDAIRDVVMDSERITMSNVRAVENMKKELNQVLPRLAQGLHQANATLTLQQNAATHVALLLAAISTQGTDKLLTAERMNRIRESCAAARIPMTVVPAKYLEQVVRRANMLHDGRARVAVDNVDTLYTLEVASCVFSRADEMRVLVKLPLLADEGRARWRAYDVTPLAFLYQGQVCQLLPYAVLAIMAVSLSSKGAEAAGSVRLMSPHQRTLCLARGICEVPRATEDVGVTSQCVRGIFNNASLDELQRVCTFTCQPYRGVQLTHVQNNQYSVVNADRRLAIRCGKSPRAEAAELVIAPQAVGAVLLDLPCRCSMQDDEQARILVAPVEPCDPRLSADVAMTVQVPALWAAHDYAFLAEGNASSPGLEPGTFVAEDWTLKVATQLAPQPRDWSQLQKPALPESSTATEGWLGVVPSLPRWLALPWMLGLTGLFFLQHRRLRLLSQGPSMRILHS